jgi:hypothetical protein
MMIMMNWMMIVKSLLHVPQACDGDRTDQQQETGTVMDYCCWFWFSQVNLIFLLNILRVVITKLRESNTAENEQIR